MRLVAWNIGAGGAGRQAGIVEHLGDLGADVAVLSAVPTNGGGAKLRGYLEEAGFPHHVTVEPPPRCAGLLVAARAPIGAGGLDGAPVPASWLHVEGLPFELGAVYGPDRDGDPACPGARARWLDWLTGAVARWGQRPALLCGAGIATAEGAAGPAGGDRSGADRWGGLLGDGWRDLHPECRGEGDGWSPCSGGAAGARDSRAFASPAFEVPVAVGHTTAGGLSDHRPLVVDVGC